MVGFLIAVLSGALMSVQGVFNTQVTKASGIWLASSFVQLTALIVCVAAWLIKERTPVSSLFLVQPKYMLLGGVIGAFITITVIKAMDMLGPAKAVMFCRRFCDIGLNTEEFLPLGIFGLHGLRAFAAQISTNSQVVDFFCNNWSFIGLLVHLFRFFLNINL